ncbi:MAG: arginase family protein [Deltaproteobacteria bacterium]|nr:arginase family protein [Deltaproteobacteria bacterium]
MPTQLLDLAQKLLTPPGNGVFTVHTAQNRKNRLHEKLYGTAEQSKVQNKWLDSLKNLLSSNESRIALLGIPSDCGGGIIRGANWGPLFLRLELQKDIADLGDVRVIPHYLHDSLLSERAKAASREALYKDSNSQLPVSPLSIAEYFLEKFYANQSKTRVFGLGGDHSVSYPLVKSYLLARKNQGTRCALLHFDAHTDLMPSRLGVDICFGSWTHHILPFLESPDDLYQVGIRSSGKERTHWEKTYGIHQFWSEEVQKDPAELGKHILKSLEQKNIDEIYISFDIDVLDMSEASATGTPETNGMHTLQAVELLKELAPEIQVGGADLVEVAPFVHHPESDQLEPETTLRSAQIIMEQILKLM